MRIDADAFRIGQRDDCDLVLKDATVSPVHAVVERSGAGWVVRNQGMHGTLVNGTAIDGSQALSPGDAIQVGAETLLQFVVAEGAKRAKAERREAAAGRPWWQHPAAIAGIAVYLLAIVGFFVFLSTIDGQRDRGLGADRVARATEATREFLMNGEVAAEADAALPLDPAVDRSRGFYELGTLRASGRAEDAAALADTILAQVEEEFFQAWQYEQRGANALAIDRYQRVIDTVPTLRAPVTRLASSRIRALREKARE